MKKMRFKKEKIKEIKVGNLKVNTNQHSVEVEGCEIDLTKKEYDLLLFLLNNLRSVLSRDQILSEVWNFDYDGDTRIVDVHIFKLRQKLENADLKIESLRGVGYVAKG